MRQTDSQRTARRTWSTPKGVFVALVVAATWTFVPAPARAGTGLAPHAIDVPTILTLIDHLRRVAITSTESAVRSDGKSPRQQRQAQQARAEAIRAANELTRNETSLEETLFGPRKRREPHNRPTAPPREMARPLPSELDTIDTVVIDPGHGGTNGGAVGVAGVLEKHLTLQLAYQLRFHLQKQFPELRVVMTRYTDRSIPLEDRTHLANRVGADLFLSLHYNAASHQRAVGFETYFLETRQVVPGRTTEPGEPIATAATTVTGVPRAKQNREFGIAGDTLPAIRRDLQRAHHHHLSGLLAEAVQKRMVANVFSIDRGVKQANFGVLRGAMMPAVVVEGGFMTHPGEGYRILYEAHRERMVRALTEALVRFDDQLNSPDERRAAGQTDKTTD